MLFNHLRDSAEFFKSNILYLAFITLPFTIPVELFSVIYHHRFIADPESLQLHWPPMIASLLVYPIYQTAVILAIAASLKGEFPALNKLWQQGIKLWFPVLTVNAAYTLAITLGFMALIIPGIIIAVRLAFRELAVVLDNKDAVSALQQSWGDTREHFGILFGGIFIIVAAIFLLSALLQSFLGLLGLPSVLSQFILALGLNLLSLLITIFTFRVYYSTHSST